MQGLLNRWMSQLDLGCTTGGLERVVSVHNTVMKKKPGLKQFPWIKTIFVFLDPDYKKYSIF